MRQRCDDHDTVLTAPMEKLMVAIMDRIKHLGSDIFVTCSGVDEECERELEEERWRRDERAAAPCYFPKLLVLHCRCAFLALPCCFCQYGIVALEHRAKPSYI